jgi:hypothetical protein
MTRRFLQNSATILVPLLFAGCSSEAARAGGRAAQEQAEPEQAGEPASDPSGAQSGTVLEAVGASSYTYLRVDTHPGEAWLAAPALSVEVGDEVTWQPGMPMSDWHSDTLDRTWDVVYLVSEIQVGGADAAPPSMPAGHPPATVATTEGIAIERLDGGATIEELYAQASELTGRPVTFRGQVVKVNFGILGANWLHVQDGTGDAANGTNDLTVTTQNEAAIGDVVIVKGSLVTDKDFGAGYRYPVLIENAEVEIER